MLTFNQVWWSTIRICDRYFKPETATPREQGSGAAGAYDLLWEGGFLELAEESLAQSRRSLPAAEGFAPRVRAISDVIGGIR